MSLLLQQLVNGLFIGSVYGLFAVGYTLVFGVLDILNMAHATVFTLGGLVALWLVEGSGMSIWAAFPLAVLFSGLLGLVLDRVAFAPLRQRSDTYFSGLISSIAMAIIFESAALGLFGAHTVRFPPNTIKTDIWRIEGVTITSLQVEIVLVALILMGALSLFLHRTRTGKAIRAVAESERTARLLGIHVDGIIASTFFVSSALGGAAGILFGLYFDALSPDMGRSIELKGLAVIVLGGMGSIPGAILGGLTFGLSEVLTVAVTGKSNLRDAVAFTVLFAVLLLRPEGLLGRRRAREV
ncbi:branched-chain amino acid ABC transporter permease [Desulforhabdus sp. TSK]|uniref:branched-chain amino acid ABC transporter permease n=1 Tax=Desulforhabdus sp. TSK TaxID=2925014 RepID=UPI001FC85AE5|nr:branched-chain amino acid ABC transporter permease [Desulforhabdus sp. TSK]GKT10470.1 branched-chain amino acid ABC transporter permease [Desulforhabdus sp. TSK]